MPFLKGFVFIGGLKSRQPAPSTFFKMTELGADTTCGYHVRLPRADRGFENPIYRTHTTAPDLYTLPERSYTCTERWASVYERSGSVFCGLVGGV